MAKAPKDQKPDASEKPAPDVIPFAHGIEIHAIAMGDACDFRAHAALDALHLSLVHAKTKAEEAKDHVAGDALAMVLELIEVL